MRRERYSNEILGEKRNKKKNKEARRKQRSKKEKDFEPKRQLEFERWNPLRVQGPRESAKKCGSGGKVQRGIEKSSENKKTGQTDEI